MLRHTELFERLAGAIGVGGGLELAELAVLRLGGVGHVLHLALQILRLGFVILLQPPRMQSISTCIAHSAHVLPGDAIVHELDELLRVTVALCACRRAIILTNIISLPSSTHDTATNPAHC